MVRGSNPDRPKVFISTFSESYTASYSVGNAVFPAGRSDISQSAAFSAEVKNE
jgi:hypothetical protein